MATIAQMSKSVRSKGAGPFWFAIDIFCTDAKQLHAYKESKNFNKRAIAKIYDVPESLVKIFFVPNLNVVKIALPRIPAEGGRNEKDMHAGQQFVLIESLEL